MKEAMRIIRPDQALLKKLGLQGKQGKDWDEKAFLEAYRAIETELSEAGEAKVKLLIKFYQDAFWKKRTQEFSEFEDRFSLPAPMSREYPRASTVPEEYDGSEMLAGSVGAFVGNRLSASRADIDRSVYGAVRMNRLSPGDFVFVPKTELGENDILGSDAFSCCTAVIVKTEKGTFYAHVTTGASGVKEVLAQARKIFPTEKIDVVRPQWKQNGNVKSESEKQWEFLTPAENLNEHVYPYVMINSDRKNGVNEFSILVIDGQIFVVGRYVYPEGRREFDFETIEGL